MSKIRWWIAEHMNRRADQCWADLVTWALGWHKGERGTGRRWPWQPVTETCRRDCLLNGACWCGKLRASTDAGIPANVPQMNRSGSEEKRGG